MIYTLVGLVCFLSGVGLSFLILDDKYCRWRDRFADSQVKRRKFKVTSSALMCLRHTLRATKQTEAMLYLANKLSQEFEDNDIISEDEGREIRDYAIRLFHESKSTIRQLKQKEKSNG